MFRFQLESTIADLENSTDEKLYCYEYITLDDDQNYVEMKIEEYPCKLKEIYSLDYKDPKREELENQVVSSSTKIPFSSNVVAETTFVNPAGRHSCDVEKDNTAYSCGTLTGEYVMLFNRLVDTDQISSITVNDVEYTLE